MPAAACDYLRQGAAMPGSSVRDGTVAGNVVIELASHRRVDVEQIQIDWADPTPVGSSDHSRCPGAYWSAGRLRRVPVGQVFLVPRILRLVLREELRVGLALVGRAVVVEV